MNNLKKEHLKLSVLFLFFILASARTKKRLNGTFTQFFYANFKFACNWAV